MTPALSTTSRRAIAVTALPSEARAALAALDQATATLLSERTDGAELAIAAANATSRMGEAVTCADGFGTGRLLGWAEAFDIVRLIATLVVAGVVVPLVVLSGAIAALPVASPRLSERLPTRLRCIACQVRLHARRRRQARRVYEYAGASPVWRGASVI